MAEEFSKEEILYLVQRDLGRLVDAFEAIADALTAYVKLEQSRFDKDFPQRPGPRDAVVTHIKTEEEKIRERLSGDESESIEQWTSLGPREREVVERAGSGTKRPSTLARQSKK